MVCSHMLHSLSLVGPCLPLLHVCSEYHTAFIGCFCVEMCGWNLGTDIGPLVGTLEMVPASGQISEGVGGEGGGDGDPTSLFTKTMK